MNCRKYLGTIVLVAAAFLSQSCSDSSGALQNSAGSSDADQSASGKSIVGFLSLYIDSMGTSSTPKGMGGCSNPPCSSSSTSTSTTSLTTFPHFDRQNTLAFWEGEDIEMPDPIGDFGCHVMNLVSPRRSTGNAIPGTNMVSVGYNRGYSVPGTAMNQAELLAVMAASNIAILNPDQEDIRLVSITEATLNNADKNPLLSFEPFETELLRPSQGSPKMHGPLYKGKYENVDHIPFGSYQLHVDSDELGAIDLPIDVAPFELKNGDSKTALKPQDLNVRKDVQLEWPFEPGQKGRVILVVTKQQGANTTGQMFCLFPNVGRATIFAEEIEDFTKIPGRTSTMRASEHTGKTIAIQQDTRNILLYIQLNRSYWK